MQRNLPVAFQEAQPLVIRAVYSTNLSDTKEVPLVMDRLVDKYPSIEAFAGDGGYRGTAVDYAITQLNKPLDIAVVLWL